MKNLKIIFVFLVFAGVASCSGDDDVNSERIDPIIGKWKMQSTTLDGIEIEIPECQARSTMEFFANGNVTSTNFYEDYETEECISESATEKWENRGNNVYRMTEGSQFTEIRVIFSNNNNVFTISEESENGSFSMTFARV